MTGFIQSSQALSSPDLQHFATSLVMNALPSLTVDPQSFSRNGALIEMAVHTAAVLLCGQNPVLQPLQNLAFCPHTMEVKRFNLGGNSAHCEFLHVPAGWLFQCWD